MNPLFLTNREDFNPPTPVPNTKNFFTYREQVAAALMMFGIPLRPAELATIDYRREVLEYFQNKLTPKQTAVMMIDKVRQVYKVERA